VLYDHVQPAFSQLLLLVHSLHVEEVHWLEKWKGPLPWCGMPWVSSIVVKRRNVVNRTKKTIRNLICIFKSRDGVLDIFLFLYRTLIYWKAQMHRYLYSLKLAAVQNKNGWSAFDQCPRMHMKKDSRHMETAITNSFFWWEGPACVSGDPGLKFHINSYFFWWKGPPCVGGSPSLLKILRRFFSY